MNIYSNNLRQFLINNEICDKLLIVFIKNIQSKHDDIPELKHELLDASFQLSYYISDFFDICSKQL